MINIDKKPDSYTSIQKEIISIAKETQTETRKIKDLSLDIVNRIKNKFLD